MDTDNQRKTPRGAVWLGWAGAVLVVLTGPALVLGAPEAERLDFEPLDGERIVRDVEIQSNVDDSYGRYLALRSEDALATTRARMHAAVLRIEGDWKIRRDGRRINAFGNETYIAMGSADAMRRHVPRRVARPLPRGRQASRVLVVQIAEAGR